MDGSGKTTQAELLCKLLEEQGLSYLLRAHPSEDSYFGRKTRAFLLREGKIARILASMFYLLDVVRSVLLYHGKEVEYVVFVRYLMGTAYLPELLYMTGYRFLRIFVPKGDYMFFIDTSPEEAHRRIEQNRDKKEMFESLERLEKVHKKVSRIAGRPEWIVINGDQREDVIHQEVRSFLAL